MGQTLQTLVMREKYPIHGYCAWCQKPIAYGEQMRRHGKRGWVHGLCALEVQGVVIVFVKDHFGTMRMKLTMPGDKA